MESLHPADARPARTRRDAILSLLAVGKHHAAGTGTRAHRDRRTRAALGGTPDAQQLVSRRALPSARLAIRAHGALSPRRALLRRAHRAAVAVPANVGTGPVSCGEPRPQAA